MTRSHASGSEDGEDKPKRQGGAWRPVDPEIWTRQSPPAKGFRRIGLFVWGVISVLFHPFAFVVLFPLLASGFVVVSFSVAYQLGGVRLFGPVVLGIWVAVAAVGVFAIQKSGYARNFEGWDFSLRRTLLLFPAFLLCVGLFYFMIFISNFFGW